MNEEKSTAPIDNTDMKPSSEERTWALACHLSTFLGYLIPFGNIIAPLIIWILKKDEMPFVNDQGKEAVNFQITVTIAALVCVVLVFLLVGIPLIILLVLLEAIVTIIAAVRAYDGEQYRYPMTLRLI